MNEQTQTQASAQDIAALQAFNESVNRAVLRNFELNNALIAEGVSPTGVALANAMSAADLTAAMAAAGGDGMDVVNVLLEKLLDDMKGLATVAFEHYQQQKAETVSAPAANDETTGA